MNISKAQGFDAHKLFNERDDLQDQLLECRKLEVFLVNRHHDPRKKVNQQRIGKIKMLIEHINEQVDMMKIIASQDKDENFLIQLVKKYKIMKAEMAETRKQKWTEPNFHELKKMNIIVPDSLTKLKPGHEANIFPKRKFGGKTFWKICAKEYELLDQNRTLLDFKSSITMVELCLCFLRDRLRATKIGKTVNYSIEVGKRVEGHLRKHRGDYVLRTYRLMAYIVRSKEFLETRRVVENRVDTCLRIGQINVTKRTFPMEEFFKERFYWTTVEMILDTFEDFADNVKVHVPYSFHCPLGDETNARKLRYDLKTYYDKTACEIPKALYLSKNQLVMRKRNKANYVEHQMRAASKTRNEQNYEEDTDNFQKMFMETGGVGKKHKKFKKHKKKKRNA